MDPLHWLQNQIRWHIESRMLRLRDRLRRRRVRPKVTRVRNVWEPVSFENLAKEWVAVFCDSLRLFVAENLAVESLKSFALSICHPFDI